MAFHRTKGRATVAVALAVAAFCAQAQPTVALQDDDIWIAEGETAEASFTVSPAPTQALTVLYSTEYTTGDAADHAPFSGSVIVPSGETSGVIEVQIIDDTLVEPPREVFRIRLLDGDGYNRGGSDWVIVVNITEGVCDRTPRVSRVIYDTALGQSSCSAVAGFGGTDLAIISSMTLRGSSGGVIRSFKPGDFSGLTGVTTLTVENVRLNALLPGLFSDLSSIQTLQLTRNELTVLPENTFSGHDSLRDLRLDQNRLTTLPSGIFSDLDDLRTLRLERNRLTTLPASIFSGLDDSLTELRLDQNRLVTLPAGIFSGLSGLGTLRMRENPGSPFRLPMLLRPSNPSENLSEELLTTDPVQVKLTLLEGAPYSLDLGLDVSGVTVSPDSVTIPAGATESQEFTITRTSETNSFEIDFDQLTALPDSFDGLEIVGVPVFYAPELATHQRPQAVQVRFTSLPKNSDFYRPQLRETVNVDVIFDREVIVPIVGQFGLPTLKLQIGANQRTATYVPNPGSDGTRMSFSYTLTPEDDADENGISVAADGLKFNSPVVQDILGRPVDATLAEPLLADSPEQKVRWIALLSFADPDGRIYGDEGSAANAVIKLDFPLREPLTVRYAVTDGTADGDDYIAGSGEVTVPAGESTWTIQIPIRDDEDLEPPREQFQIELTPSPPNLLGAARRLTVVIREGVCDRTSQVSDEIVFRLGQSDCAAPDGDDLGKVTSLDLSSTGIANLKQKDFSGLAGLRVLELNGNALTELPVGVFDGLGELATLNLQHNQFRTLRLGTFTGLGNVIRLRLNNNQLTSLPPGVFAGINRNVTEGGFNNLWLHLQSNGQLSSLPPGVFSGINGVNDISLSGNGLHELPADLFTGISDNLRVFNLGGNLGAPFSLRLRTEFAGGPGALVSMSGETVPLKVTLREGAPYPFQVSLMVEGGQESASVVEFPAGATQSETFTVTRTPGAAQTTVSFLNLDPPTPPVTCEFWQRAGPEGDKRCFNGLSISTATALVLSDDAPDPSVCDRTPEIQQAILGLWDGDDCRNFPAYLLRIATHLDVSSSTVTVFSSSDFNDMDALESLDLSDNDDLEALSEGGFGGLGALKRLDLSASGLRELDPRAFAGLTGLEQLLLHDNDLRELPPGIFEGLDLGRPAGSLRLEGNPDDGSPAFVLTAGFEVASFDGDALEFYLYLPQGAPFDLPFPLTVQGAVSPPPPPATMTIPAGSTQSPVFSVTRQFGQRLSLNSDAPPALPQGNSGCGYDPCYDGFEIRAAPPLYSALRVTRVEFTSAPQYSDDSYVAGLETITVDVTFDEELTLDTSGAPPTLALRVGDLIRTAAYVSGAERSNSLSFSYSLTLEDLDADGVSIASADGLKLNGARITNVLEPEATLSLAGFLNPAAGHKVRRSHVLSFETASVSGAEGETLDLVLTSAPAAVETIAVSYALSYDSADAGDHEPLSGNAELPANAASATIRVRIRDDTDVEPPRERFQLELTPSPNYLLGAARRLTVVIREGVCDRTPQVGDEIVFRLGQSDCAAPDGDDLGKVTSLDLSSTGIANLKQKDFSGLAGLRVLELDNNALTSLPVGVFDGLGALRTLELFNNRLKTLRSGTFTGLGNVRRLRLYSNQLSSLPPGVFTGVNRNVTEGGFNNLWVELHNNRLTSLPPRVFSGINGVNTISLSGNDLRELPADLFTGISDNLRVFNLSGNFGAPFSLRLRTEFAGGPGALVSASGENVPLKVTLREGAPYPFQVNLMVEGGQESASVVEFPAGATQSETFTVTRTPGAAQTLVSFLSLDPPTPPVTCAFWQQAEGRCFNGLSISTATALVLSDDAPDPSVCVRTPEIRQAILGLWDGDDCRNFPAYLLRIATHLDVSSSTVTVFSSSDFNDMDALESLDLSSNDNLQGLDGNQFTSLGALKRLDLSSGGLRDLRPLAFAGLTGLEQLLLHDNDLRELPPGIFEGLDLGRPAGSLRLEGNPDDDSPPFVLTAGFEVVSFDGDVLEFYPALPQGAPFDLSFSLTAQGAVSPPPATITIPAGSTRILALTVQLQAEETLRLSLDDPPAPPEGNSGCGYDPCYDGFEIAVAPPLYSTLRVTEVQFTSTPRYSNDSYVAGAETITVDVIFSGETAVDTSEGLPTLALRVGNLIRTAAYVQDAERSSKLSFSYPLNPDDLDVDGVSIASADGLKLNGARITNVLPPGATLSLKGFLSPEPGQKVRKGRVVSFETASVSGAEGETLDLVLTSAPAAVETIAVSYALSYDSADAGDHEPLSGNAELPANAASATIRVLIRDDTDVEPPRERFQLELTPSPNYTLGATPRLTVVIKEGVCDRTPQVRDEIVFRLGQSDCAAPDGDDLGEVTSLNLSSTGIASLKQKDFSGLAKLEVLELNHNALTALPVGVFDGLGELSTLDLQHNQLEALRLGTFTGQGKDFPGLASLRVLELNHNALTELPVGLFDGLGELATLNLQHNQLRTLRLGAFTGLGKVRRLRLNNNQLSSLPPGVFAGVNRNATEGGFNNLWLHLNDNQLSSLPPGVFSGINEVNDISLGGNNLHELPADLFTGISDNLRVFNLSGNFGAPFSLRLRTEFAGGPDETPASGETAPVKLTLREGAPYRLQADLVVEGGLASASVVELPAGSTQSEAFTVIRAAGAEQTTVSLTNLDPPTPPVTCASWQRVDGRCFNGLEIDSSLTLVFDDDPAVVSDVSIASSPFQGDTYAGGDPDEEIVVAIVFSRTVEVLQTENGPRLTLEIGSAMRLAAYDEERSSATSLVFLYKPQSGDNDDDGISVPADALKLNGARILDRGVPVSLNLGVHAIRNAPGHKVKSGGIGLRIRVFLEGALE